MSFIPGKYVNDVTFLKNSVKFYQLKVLNLVISIIINKTHTKWKVNEPVASHEPANNAVIHAEEKTEHEINLISKEFSELVEQWKQK